MNRLMNEYIINFLAQYDDSPEGNFKKEVVKDLWISKVSREASLMGRREVLTGKAKFGILGDGKEVPQVAFAKYFKNGDFRSGYYRDQTFMFAADLASVEDFYAQLYADVENDPFSGGRQMNAHFATRMIDEDGAFLDLTQLKNVTPDISPTAGQMARALGVAMASKKFRELPDFDGKERLSKDGNEISFVTIGDASTSEGIFWESINAAAVNRVPLCVIVWDDGYGISVPTEKQTIKSSISAALEGFELEDGDDNGIIIETVKAWDYPALCSTFESVTSRMREEHRPALIHVQEVTQPQGHSTSGSHERYKSEDRLNWETDKDCIRIMESWMIDNDIITVEHVDEINEQAIKYVRNAKKTAWSNYTSQVTALKKQLINLLNSNHNEVIADAVNHANREVTNLLNPARAEVIELARKLMHKVYHELRSSWPELRSFVKDQVTEKKNYYGSNLYSETSKAAINVPTVAPIFSDDSVSLNGYEILNKYFDRTLETRNDVIAFGEDVGQIGDVNQGFAGLQEKYGEERVFDTGIREWSIMGMAIGTAMRGLRPIAEIQYLDYLIYGISPLSDDLATLRYRSNGLCHAPAIIRTRGHRLEGIWHAGSPMGMIVNSLRGIYVCVPRNMTQAVGFYNTMLQSDDPALIVECLNGYRLKETLPDNLDEFTVPLGVPEVLVEGQDLTIVTYGSVIREAEKAMERLDKIGISVELIDVQTLIPFDLEGIISLSLKKTNKVIFLDEDVPGGASAYMMQQVLEVQHGYKYLDASPKTIAAAAHRPPYGSDGDYFSKPNADDIYEGVLDIMMEYNPEKYGI